MNSTTNTNQDPAEIERDIRRTQEDMSRTVDKIGDQLSLRNVFNALLDKADDNDIDARMVVDGARRNPIALGLIAAGTIWLVSDKNSKFPSMGSDKSRKPGEPDFEGQDVHHRDYVAHMSSVEAREGEDPAAYQRRRDTARASFLMCEPKPDEDEHKFRERLDSMTETFRQKRSAWMDSADHARQATTETARQAVSRTKDLYDSNPVVGGILAAALGAAFASALPLSRTEQEKLGDLGHKARDVASDKKDEVESKLREKKDEVVGKAEQKLQESGSSGQSNRGTPEMSGAGSSPRRPEPAPSGRSRF